MSPVKHIRLEIELISALSPVNYILIGLETELVGALSPVKHKGLDQSQVRTKRLSVSCAKG